MSDRRHARPPRRMRALLWRGAGLLYLAAATATSLIHRAILAGGSHAPATIWELVLGLLSFGFASLGMVLLIGGVRLRDDWKRRCDRPDGAFPNRP